MLFDGPELIPELTYACDMIEFNVDGEKFLNKPTF
jgi:hypothetical protein